jgi:hypothetical protein
MAQQHTAALHKALTDVVQVAVAADADASKFPQNWMFHVRCVTQRSQQERRVQLC